MRPNELPDNFGRFALDEIGSVWYLKIGFVLCMCRKLLNQLEYARKRARLAFIIQDREIEAGTPACPFTSKVLTLVFRVKTNFLLSH